VLSYLHLHEDNNLKGLYEFFAVLSLRGFRLSPQMIPLILDQLSSTHVAAHLETQLNALIVWTLPQQQQQQQQRDHHCCAYSIFWCYYVQIMEHVLPDITNELASYNMKILVHVLRVMNILTTIIQHKTTSLFRESKLSTSGFLFVSNSLTYTHRSHHNRVEYTIFIFLFWIVDSPIGSIYSESLYQILWERLKDTYRLSQSSFTLNLFDQIRHQTLCVCISIQIQHISTFFCYGDNVCCILTRSFPSG
jgi:hypothetical protein